MFITVNDKEAKARAIELITNAVDEALTLVEPEEITEVLHNLYLEVNDMIDIH